MKTINKKHKKTSKKDINKITSNKNNNQQITLGRKDILSIPNVALLLAKNNSQSKIARTYGTTPSAVSQFIKRHKVELHDLLNYDTNISLVVKHINNKILDNVTDKDIYSASLKDKAIASKVLFEEHRLVEGKATAIEGINISDEQVKEYQAIAKAIAKEHIKLIPQHVVPIDDKTDHIIPDKIITEDNQ